MNPERSIDQAAKERAGKKPGAAPAAGDGAAGVGNEPDRQAPGGDTAPAGSLDDRELDESLGYVDAALEADLAMPKGAHGAEQRASAQLDNHGEGRLVELDLDELAARATKADEYLELAKRTRADFENYRKRADREVASAQQRGIARLTKELLPAIDNLDRAAQAALTLAPDEEEPSATPESQLASGIRLVHADVLAALARVGIEPFSPAGEQFDPQYHEAVAQAPHPGVKPGTVVEVYQPGYRIGETVLRPARVLVAA
jgi:molecular chaperone GrpE